MGALDQNPTQEQGVSNKVAGERIHFAASRLTLQNANAVICMVRSVNCELVK